MIPFETSYTVTDAQTDEKGLCKLSTLLYFAQEAAGEHCVTLGLDWETMQSRKLFWAVIRTRVVITRLPRAGEQVRVTTWPMPTTRVAYPRMVVLTDETGSPIAKILSLWVLMNTESRKMLLPGKSGVTVEGILVGNEPDTPDSLPPLQEGSRLEKTVTEDLLDKNGHMNNAKYLDWVQALLGAAPVNAFTVNYLSEALPGDRLTICHEAGPDRFRLDILRREGEQSHRIFAAEIT